jgi:hypothetical protein
MIDFRALCAELVEAYEWCINRYMTAPSNKDALVYRARAALEAQPEPQGPMPEVDDILRLAAIIRRVDGNHDKGAAALAEAILSHPDSRWQHARPEPQGPTAWMYRGEPDFDGERWRENWKVTLDEKVARFKSGNKEPVPLWGRPAIEPVPKREDVHYAWELHDAEGEWQAGGSAYSLDDVKREGNRYLQTYSQHGPHKLIIERHCVTTIEPVPKREAEQ